MFEFEAGPEGSTQEHVGAADPHRHGTSAYERELECFLAMVRHGGFTQAASSLGISKGLLKKRLQAFDTRFGEPLFRVTGNLVSMTEAGQACYRHISQPSASGAPPGADRPPLRLAMPAILMETVFCRPLMSWLRGHVNSRVVLLDDASSAEADILLWIHQGDSVAPPAQYAQQQYLGSLDLVPCVARRSLVRHDSLISVASLEDYRLVQYEGYAGWPGLTAWNGLVASRRYGVTTVRSPEMYWRLVKWLGCLGLMPAWSCRHDNTLLPLPLLLPPLTAELWMGCRPSAMLGSEGRLLCQMIEQIARDSLAAPM